MKIATKNEDSHKKWDNLKQLKMKSIYKVKMTSNDLYNLKMKKTSKNEY